MSSIFQYSLFSHYTLFGVLFIYLFVLTCFLLLSLGTDDFENLQELDFHDLE
jgi:hypothetical protein